MKKFKKAKAAIISNCFELAFNLMKYPWTDS